MSDRAAPTPWSVRLAGAYLAFLVLLAMLAPAIANDGPRALIGHAAGEPNAFVRLQPPGHPRVRVLPMAGSHAAQALGLTELTRRDDDEFVGRPVMLSTLQQRGRESSVAPDFVIVAASMERFTVRVDRHAAAAEIAAHLSSATGGIIEASFDPTADRFTLRDHSLPGDINWLGTDRHGADVAANLVHASRTVVIVALVATLIAFLLGVGVGSLMGGLGGAVDFLGLRLIEIFSAAPRLLLLLIVASALSPAYGRHMTVVLMVVIGLTTWMGPARLIRGEMLRLRQQEFVMAARAVGAPPWRVVMRHLLPNAIVPVLVEATFYMSAAVLLETNLSFLGLGVRPPGASWGGMLADAVDRSTGQLNWWLLAFPGAMVFLTILSIHTIGEWWRRRLGVKPAWIKST
jgi:peptide/nickel transport system permease protein